jgi:hypothetical protein
MSLGWLPWMIGCAAPVDPPVTVVDPTCPGWMDAGAPVLTTYCTACHSATLVGDTRHGAPAGVDLDTLAGARTQADRIRARALDARDMPSGGGIAAADRARLAAWLDCGTPGEELVWPATTAATRADEVSDRVVTVDADGGDLLYVGAWGGVDREVYRFRKGTDVAWWLEEEFRDADGAVEAARSWDPPLVVWQAGVTAWTSDAVATDADGASTDETWTFSLGLPDEIDAQVRDPAAEALTGTSTAGDTYTWLLSPTSSVVERRRVTPEIEEVSLGLTIPEPYAIAGFPIEDGTGWFERAWTRHVEAR